MDAYEQLLAVSVSVSARPIIVATGQEACSRARARVRMPQTWSIYEGIAAHTAEPIGRLSDNQLLGRAGVRLNPNCATNTSPIQYP